MHHQNDIMGMKPFDWLIKKFFRDDADACNSRSTDDGKNSSTSPHFSAPTIVCGRFSFTIPLRPQVPILLDFIVPAQNGQVFKISNGVNHTCCLAHQLKFDTLLKHLLEIKEQSLPFRVSGHREKATTVMAKQHQWQPSNNGGGKATTVVVKQATVDMWAVRWPSRPSLQCHQRSGLQIQNLCQTSVEAVLSLSSSHLDCPFQRSSLKMPLSQCSIRTSMGTL